MKYKIITFILLISFNAYIAHYLANKFSMTVFTADIIANIIFVFIIDYMYQKKILNGY